ncbi:Uu.00g144270.m01.CDS01 [Anthostomella pinea]|uniref:Uu.00g144270.m01.CDS01 n=1 Tax=Anthostomella pinea TaxID=933095 RepID=A0AAI8VQT2_9PEZI|nr:Uu.00g144270.m01.CDS01 [Anthostomella pinea]
MTGPSVNTMGLFSGDHEITQARSWWTAGEAFLKCQLDHPRPQELDKYMTTATSLGTMASLMLAERKTAFFYRQLRHSPSKPNSGVSIDPSPSNIPTDFQPPEVVVQPDQIVELEESTESIANLVLGEAELKTLRALSTRQNSKRDIWAADFIEGKGTGQIILLHGPPGVGKTYTVEAIAEYLHRPLLSLTIADIGTVEKEVERELIKWFALAEVWNAVLLVDEADIFLERRQNRDLARNGLVAAFLRRMEYFKGLLFLTTNRVGQIDDAFISRVHVAIGYQALTPEVRVKIWEGFFRKLLKERPGKIQIAAGAKKWVLNKAASGGALLNGRDIRNALQTAITLAEAECEEDPDFDPETMTVVVEQAHFERVLEISNKFHTYVESIRREDEKKRAAGRFDRNDYWAAQQGDDDRD